MSNLPSYRSAARSALEERILTLFAAGNDTMQIAASVNATEAQVYNILARLAR